MMIDRKRESPGGPGRRQPRRFLPVAGLALLLAIPASGQAPPAPEDVAAPPPDAERTESGLASKVLVPGTGEARPDGNDMVQVHFTGWTKDGVKVYSTHDEGKKAIFDLATAFPGWKEAIQLMTVGEKRRVWIPEHLGSKKPRPGAQRASVFEIELFFIGPIPNPPADLETPPAEAERTPSGAFTERVEAGWGEEKPDPASSVLLNYIGWTTDGKVFDSSYSRGRSTAFPLEDVLPPFAEAVQQMVVGERRRIWIPGPLAAGNWTGSPRGTLVFEVQLVRILPPGSLKKSTGDPQTGAG